MARSLRAQKLETRTNRLKLKIQGKPYWAQVGKGLGVGYRRNKGPGTWTVRVSNGRGGYWSQEIGIADDYEDASSGRTLDFWMARDRAREIGLGARNIGDGSDGKLADVAGAVNAYAASLRTRGGDHGNADRIRCHLPEKLAAKTVALLTAQDFKPWTAALTRAGLSPASRNRVNAVFKACLNHAGAQDERIANQRAWERALTSIPDATTARNTILDERAVRAIITASRAVSPEFGLFIELAAVTGARVSQLAKLEVRDVQAGRVDSRIMLPSSKKGRGRKRVERRPVPIPAELAVRLLANAAGRPDEAPLLTKPGGAPWRKSDHTRPFARAVATVVEQEAKRLGVSPDMGKLSGHTPGAVTVYALRHSAIVRGLLGGVPLRVIAVNADTSAAIIEQVYSRFISDHADAVARRALLDLSEPADSKIVPLRLGA